MADTQSAMDLQSQDYPSYAQNSPYSSQGSQYQTQISQVPIMSSLLNSNQDLTKQLLMATQNEAQGKIIANLKMENNMLHKRVETLASSEPGPLVAQLQLLVDKGGCLPLSTLPTTVVSNQQKIEQMVDNNTRELKDIKMSVEQSAQITDLLITGIQNALQAIETQPANTDHVRELLLKTMQEASFVLSDNY